MAMGGPSPAQLKRDLDSLAHDLYNIELQNSTTRAGGPQSLSVSRYGNSKVTDSEGDHGKGGWAPAEKGTGKERQALGWYHGGTRA